MIEEACQGAGRLGLSVPGYKPNFERTATGFNSRLECFRHTDRVCGYRDRGIHQHCVSAHLHCFCGVRRRAQSGVDDHGY